MIRPLASRPGRSPGTVALGEEPGDDSESDSRDEGYEGGDECDCEVNTRCGEHAGEDIEARDVCPEPVDRAWRTEARASGCLDGKGRDRRAEKGQE